MQFKNVIFFKLDNGREPVFEWIESLDKSVSFRIINRLYKVEEGNFGDFKKIDNEISELRFKFGSGYRIYFANVKNIMVLLLSAGDKKTQSKDIKIAKEYLKIWKGQNNDSTL